MMNPAGPKDFIHDYMWNPLAAELPVYKKAAYLLGTLALGVATLGLFHATCALTLKDRNITPYPQKTKLDPIRKVRFDAELPNEQRIAKLLHDRSEYQYNLDILRGQKDPAHKKTIGKYERKIRAITRELNKLDET